MKSRIDEIVKEVRGPRVLDVGCAGGLQTHTPPIDSADWLHGRLLDLFPDTWGIDLSHERVDYLRERGIPNTVAADAESFELNHRFDTIVAGEIIEHLGNPRSFLLAAKRHLRLGGRIVLTTPYAAGLPNVLYAWLKFPKTCSNPEHTTWFCPSTIETLGDLADLRIEHWRLIEDFPTAYEKWSLYRVATWFYRLFRLILPRRVRANCLLVVFRINH